MFMINYVPCVPRGVGLAIARDAGVCILLTRGGVFAVAPVSTLLSRVQGRSGVEDNFFAT